MLNGCDFYAEELVDTWLGGTDEAEEDVWRWNENNEVFSYTNWARFEPNNAQGREHCFEFKTDRGNPVWNDEFCTADDWILCEYPVLNGHTITP